ncbi:DUF3280 domain-containing protein [Prosthecomicrobium sp. N25]|uniref:DUF3280 domain-containing protein n=1 Tax=Prosthecomicrobium sp. N25 TaxID=3129254 RepID=UPI0030780287
MPTMLAAALRSALLAVALALAGLAPSSAAAAKVKVALFLFELEDTSLEGELRGERADETARLRLVTDEARRLIAEADPDVAFVDLAPVAAKLAEKAPLYKCNGCEADLAREAGADLSVSGWVQKVSNLILNLNLSVRDARTGERLRLYSADIRTNSDEMWLRGMRYLVKNRLMEHPLSSGR